jgi:hypothetical protein
MVWFASSLELAPCYFLFADICRGKLGVCVQEIGLTFKVRGSHEPPLSSLKDRPPYGSWTVGVVLDHLYCLDSLFLLSFQ